MSGKPDHFTDQAVIQHAKGEDKVFLDTAWTLEIVRGVLLYVACVTMAFPIAKFYDKPELVPLLSVVGLTAVISGFKSVNLITLKRNMFLGKLTFLEIFSQLASFFVMVSWASLFPSVWILVAGAMISVIIRTIFSHAIIEGRKPCFAWDREAVKHILTFGKWIFLSSALTFFGMQSDRFILGKLMSFETLGIYSIGMMIATLPYEIVTRLSQMVIYPEFSLYARISHHHLAERLHKSRSGVLAIASLAILVMVLEIPTFIDFFYPIAYHPAGAITQLLGAFMWVNILQATADRASLALGDSKALATSNAFRLVGAVGLSIAGYFWLGLTGFTLGLTAGTAIGYIPIHFSLRKFGIQVIGQDVKFTLLLGVPLFLCLGLEYLFALTMPALPQIVSALIIMIYGGFVAMHTYKLYFLKKS